MSRDRGGGGGMGALWHGSRTVGTRCKGPCLPGFHSLVLLEFSPPPNKSCGRPRHMQKFWNPTSGHAQVRPALMKYNTRNQH